MTHGLDSYKGTQAFGLKSEKSNILLFLIFYCSQLRGTIAVFVLPEM